MGDMSKELIFDGERLQQRRIALHLSVSEVARRLGTHRKTIWLAERGQASVNETFDLAAFLGLEPEDIIKRVRKLRSDKGKSRHIGRLVDRRPVITLVMARTPTWNEVKASEDTPKTAFGRKLERLRNKAIAQGEKLLSEDEVLEEVRRRRGG